jgi:hypothetical protein
VPQRPGLARQRHKRELGDIFGEVVIAHLAVSGGVNQPDMRLDQPRKRLGRARPGILRQPLRFLSHSTRPLIWVTVTETH